MNIRYNIHNRKDRFLYSISQGLRGWEKEVNVMRWNGRKAKVDIRDWDGKHEKMGKGITLDREEILKLRDLLNKIDIDELDVK
ncbi:YdbC family protein [Clostridium sp. LBM24168]